MSKSSIIQAHTDKYQLLGVLDPDTGEIKPLKLGDDTVSGLAVQLYVWDSVSLDWQKMEQPYFTLEGDVEVNTDDLEANITDQLQQYKMDDFDTANDPTFYLGFQDKGGNWYIKRINTGTGAVDYVKGTSGYSTAWTGRAAQSYNDFATIFGA